jgi:hypothetical protein
MQRTKRGRLERRASPLIATSKSGEIGVASNMSVSVSETLDCLPACA